ncbi:MAG: transglycosylase SLT domain-containing protein [Candidatus Binatus sp.]|uniref:transglycosylase SLT domain-containing protein n=1 Tax=Candidatus Binatus sp. TaxID=2811406 RepID=UPI00271CDF16|nr:transglycosylase SLT domain-containing protein [Candidatus Binatus sp.]MDO8431696.1 transglycosylase SLT domain-containing protein [Candidatus Binatus sp.]
MTIDGVAPIRIARNARRASRRLVLWMIVAAIVISAATPRPVRAAQIKVPLTIDYLALREALQHTLYTAPGNRAPLWNGADECQFLFAENPNFMRASADVKLETAASLGMGVSLGGRCISPIAWDGIVEAIGKPYIASGLQLKFHFADLNLYKSNHEKSMLVSKGFDLIKQYLIPRLELFSYDLNPAIQQLGSMAEDAGTPAVAARIHAAMASLTADPQIVALDDGVRVTLLINVPDLPAPTPAEGIAPTPAPLTPAEIAAFQTLLDQWDAFLVFAVKQLGSSVGDQQFRGELLKILLDSRYRLVQALRDPAASAGPDPVREIFLDEWRQLHDAVKAAAARGMLGARALEFLSFISAGDALFALDQAAPALGMRISAADLRRLAHLMAPQAAGDPLKFNFDEDADLKKLFDVPEPAESSGPLDTSEEIVATPTASPSALATPTSPLLPEPSPAPSAAPTPTPAPISMIPASFSVLSPRAAFAAEGELLPRLESVAKKLRRVVVTEENFERYRDDMKRLLELSADQQIAEGGVDRRFRTMYPLLVQSVAWQESCWRQFIVANSRIKWLESATGDIGLMQVNKHVWRGFYSVERLKWDVLYNAGAGSEILTRMMMYALAHPANDPAPVADHLSRSTYAAYNGGPNACNRWRSDELPPLRKIDESFWEKFRAVKHGEPIDILACAAHWGT